eukprot:TRINITY_DN3108_c0_g1_i3.p1 TRINITY_DN3108_c0_g1~~TRINITY_DN3108_c0_g1_i3.p1  ORF type:complete len:374 (-),score=74.65 TRINITY_DN3108_c0_g1_i3:24-1145(-)
MGSIVNPQRDRVIEPPELAILAEQFRKYMAVLLASETDTHALGSFMDYMKANTAPDQLFEWDNDQLNKIGKFTLIMNDAWNGSLVTDGELEKFEKLMAESVHRRFLVMALQQYRLSGKLVLSDSGYENMSKLLNVLLTKCLTATESSTPLRMMILSLTYYKKESAFKKVFLSEAISKHPLWKHTDFWDCAILDSIREELSKVDLRTMQLAGILEREKNTVFGQLSSIAYNMLLFGLETNSVRLVIWKFCQSFNLPDKMRKDILTYIDNASKLFQTAAAQPVASAPQPGAEAPRRPSDILTALGEKIADIFTHEKPASEADRSRRVSQSDIPAGSEKHPEGENPPVEQPKPILEGHENFPQSANQEESIKDIFQ